MKYLNKTITYVNGNKVYIQDIEKVNLSAYLMPLSWDYVATIQYSNGVIDRVYLSDIIDDINKGFSKLE